MDTDKVSTNSAKDKVATNSSKDSTNDNVTEFVACAPWTSHKNHEVGTARFN